MLTKIGEVIESILLGILSALEKGTDKFIDMIERNKYKAIAITSLIIAILIALFVYVINHEINECAENGGEYKTTYHTSTIMIDGEMKVITTSDSKCIYEE